MTILYPESLYDDDAVERAVHGSRQQIVVRSVARLADLPAEECERVEGLMLFRLFCAADDLARFPRLRAIVRMGVGYDRVDRATAAARDIVICNVPDYCTTEVADHALGMVLALRRGLLAHHDAQRAAPPAPWAWIDSPLVRRSAGQVLGVVGLGRIGTALAFRARALGFTVTFHDPFLPSGVELALGIERAATLDELLVRADVLSLHAPLTSRTRGLIGPREFALLPDGAVLVNTARGALVDVDALAAALRSGRLAGAGLDVLPLEPPVEPVGELLAAYRARAPWLEGRLIVTAHSAFYSPQAWDDLRRKAAETMAAALRGEPRNVIAPDAE